MYPFLSLFAAAAAISCPAAKAAPAANAPQGYISRPENAAPGRNEPPDVPTESSSRAARAHKYATTHCHAIPNHRSLRSESSRRITARADTQGGYSNRNTRNAPAAGRSNSSGSAAASAPPPEAPSTTASVDTTASLATSPAYQRGALFPAVQVPAGAMTGVIHAAQTGEDGFPPPYRAQGKARA